MSAPAAKGHTFVCDNCGGTFEQAWTDDEMQAEFNTLFPGHEHCEKALICDDCFNRITAWAKQQGLM